MGERRRDLETVVALWWKWCRSIESIEHNTETIVNYVAFLKQEPTISTFATDQKGILAYKTNLYSK